MSQTYPDGPTLASADVTDPQPVYVERLGALRKKRIAANDSARSWPHTNSVKKLIRHSGQDSDPVSMFTTGADEHHEDLAIVVLSGNQTVRWFREMAERNNLLTPGKSVDGGDS